MTDKAKNACKSKLSNGELFIPSLFLIDGDSKEGYNIKIVDSDLCGFDIIGLRSFYAVKSFVNQLNATGYTDFEKHCAPGSFAWRFYSFETTIN